MDEQSPILGARQPIHQIFAPRWTIEPKRLPISLQSWFNKEGMNTGCFFIIIYLFEQEEINCYEIIYYISSIFTLHL